MLKNCYVGYASSAYGDEGIGPYNGIEEHRNDTTKHVRERLDAWEQAFKGMETKIFMGGPSDYGFKKGYGVRRGFVEMYYYCLPDGTLGSYVDSKGYIKVDETSPLFEYNCFNGEVNEEYGPDMGGEKLNYRFGLGTTSFPYRYFISNLRALQMQCTYLHVDDQLVPQMLPFIALELGRTVKDAPDVWSFLNTAYIRTSNYSNNDWQKPKRTFTSIERNEGIEIKNFERWLHQRDATGYETTPEEKILHPIKMWMMQPEKYFDYIARSGKKIGFNIDERWPGVNESIALKITYLDKAAGMLNLIYNDGNEQVQKSKSLIGDNQLRTVTFLIPKIALKTLPNNFDFTLEAGNNTDRIVISMVRLVRTNLSTDIKNTHEQNKEISIFYQSDTHSIIIQGKNMLSKVFANDLSGKSILESKIQGYSSTVILPNLNQGVYLITVKDQLGNTTTQKISIK